MTIRRRLLRMTIISCALVALAIASGVVFLGSVSRRLDSVRSHSVTEIQESSHAAEALSEITARLGELIALHDDNDAQATSAVRKELSLSVAKMSTALERLRIAVDDQAKAGNAKGAVVDVAAEDAEARALRKFLNNADEVRHGWMALSSTPQNSWKLDTLETLDERADKLLHEGLDYQGTVTQAMLSELGATSSSVTTLSWFSALGGAMIVLAAFVQGTIISRGLANRLDIVRRKAQQIGAGDLAARVEVKGDDEVDQLCVAFNAMVAALRTSRGQLEHDALHDALTGLPNRALFLERVSFRLADARRHNDFRFAVLFIDLDHFKLVNDSLGHAAGDKLLEVVSARLTALMKSLDDSNGSSNTVARLGGDEFTVLIERFGEDATDHFITDVADRVQATLSAPIDLEGHDLTMTVSIGVIVGAAQYEDSSSLLRDADAALYRAKEEGRGRHAVFDLGMHETVVTRLRLENDLRRALEREEMVLHYQPINDLETGEQLGFEALIRWMREGVLVSPDQFIPIAEQTGQIIPIGEWVIDTACRQLQEWRAHGRKSLSMSVNVSARQLTDANLVPHIRRVLLQTGLEPKALIVEITESALVERGLPMATLAAIRAMGVRVYIDDFGTGYSTLSGLNRYPVDGLKIDRSFVMKNDGTRDQTAVLKAVIDLAHDLNMPVVAEGVETAGQLAMLQGLGCDRAQGFLFSRPVPAQQAGEMLMPETRPVKNVA